MTPEETGKQLDAALRRLRGLPALTAEETEEAIAKRGMQAAARPLDVMIGRLDWLLSEFLISASSDLDEADRQTVKHHAEDLIGVGNAALKRLGIA